MLSLRPKSGTSGNEWRCFYCLHVRSGTILLGVWHLMLHLTALFIITMILRDPELLKKLQGEEQPVPLPTPLSNVDSPAHPYTSYRPHSFVYHDIDMGALVTFCTLTINVMLVYGAVKGKPAHLLPFFCLQLFDFAITILTATGYLCYLRSLHKLVAESKHLPWRAQLLQLSPAQLSFVVMVSFMTAMIVKIYCINVVWRCYKYLTMRQYAMLSLLPFTPGLVENPPNRTGTPSTSGPVSAPLPDYEEALKQSPPPSYQMATAHLLENSTRPQSPPQSSNTNIPV